MTIDQPLIPDLAVPDGTSQWRADTLQMVNWGGFHGWNEARYSPGSTLISGASGTGKSTMLDAYIALMMPSDTPFNGASNEAGGRARSAEQRNLLSYLRGKTDTNRVEDSERDLVLRGADGAPTWGALGMTFVNDSGRKYTVARLYFVKPGAIDNSGITTAFVTLDGYLNLSRLEPLAKTRFTKRALRAAFSKISVFETFWEFEDNVHTRLGIGGASGGRKAMRLLARLQANMQLKRVDTLYKTMVLEVPGTYQAADNALEHFADIEASHSKMVDEAKKVETLRRLPDLQRDLERAQDDVDLIHGFGADSEDASPFRLWRLRTERALLDTAVEENRRARAKTTAEFQQAQQDETDHQTGLDKIAEDKRANGGDVIDDRLRQIKDLESNRNGVYEENLRFQLRTKPIHLVVPDKGEQFSEAQAAADEFLAGFEGREAALKDEEDAYKGEELYPLTTRQAELLKERKSLQGRAGMVPDRLHRARVRMAEAAGLDPVNDLPFVAELIDVLPDEEHWRKAIETTLGGLARVVLVDQRTLTHLSSSIDGVLIRPRIQFQAVILADTQDWRGDPDHVSGKLAFKDSPFARWVQERVSDTGIDHLCVPDAAALTGDGPRVTPAGQTRHGSKGAHGESGDGNIIGFSNERRLADIDTALADLDPQIEEVRKRIKDVQDRLGGLGRQRVAHQCVADTAWSSIDYLGVDRKIADLRDEIQRFRGANKILDELQAKEERLKPLWEEATRLRVLAADRLETLEKKHGDLATKQDEVQDAVDEIDNEQSVTVTGDQQEYLDELFKKNWAVTNPDTFSYNMRAMRNRLRSDATTAQVSVRRATEVMEQMFKSFQAQWSEHNLGTTVASAAEYREILDRIQTAGLHERREKWQRELAAWSSDDLLKLNDVFDTAIDDIEQRLVPINAILRGLPFGGKGILQIDLRRPTIKGVEEFRRRLRELSSGVAAELTDHQVETRFKKLHDFMALIRVPEGHSKTSTPQRDRYLDVRQHVVITAVCLDENDREIAVHDSLGGKSGGESQELIAFIVGSALRYQLGDETRSRPRFAPVFLDEAFVKADSEYAGRAVRAWQDLGFQLIIGAPLDKVTALEPHMDLILTITKNNRGYSYITALPDGAE
ncbi:ATP-binding protein [Nocardiopsis synnemataformans]|uniref:ATP-binding protein n=1 Tax=Nocardiopsis synnemataformans TaxID=61305 RepID=UPI003EC11FEE